MNSVKSNHLSLKSQSFTPSDNTGIVVRTFKFVIMTQLRLTLSEDIYKKQPKYNLKTIKKQTCCNGCFRIINSILLELRYCKV